MRIELPTLPAPLERVRGCCAPVAAPLPDAEAARLGTLFKALADPARLQILHMLKAAEAPVCVCDFTAALDVGQPTVSHHLARLKDAGLVTSEKRGVWAFYTLATDLDAAASAALALVPYRGAPQLARRRPRRPAPQRAAWLVMGRPAGRTGDRLLFFHQQQNVLHYQGRYYAGANSQYQGADHDTVVAAEQVRLSARHDCRLDRARR